MNGLRRTHWTAFVWLTATVGSSHGQTAPAPELAASEAIVEQILELRERLEILMQALPPELRQEVERRWNERRGLVPGADESAPADSPEAAAAATATRPPLPAPALREPAAPRPADSASAAPASPATTAAALCGTLLALDSNEDGLVSGADRYWRYLRLWAGSGADEPPPSELVSLYELEIRELDVGLSRFRTSDEIRGDIVTDNDGIRLELLGRAASLAASALLVIDAGRLARSGELRLVDSAGEPLAGYRVLRPGVVLESADGSRWPIGCPSQHRPPA